MVKKVMVDVDDLEPVEEEVKPSEDFKEQVKRGKKNRIITTTYETVGHCWYCDQPILAVEGGE